ncbi:hypothetical protein AA0111_g9205 [Alternaria arborescens]|uniref:hypothetical protein n=1 Tax=Alternaria arborescens TaxID=156630 RepID=UPI001074FFB6|nr:hypothetical protein AA0111_g9205 [Alternaria arborescens]RYO22892.1 hypothetical protein AA0111_g9205 [Alternaria arborescens]
MSRFPYISSLNESWQELVDWDDELYDPLFQGETSYTRAQEGSYVVSHQLSESYTSEPTYLVSAPPSVVDEPPSLEYTVSGPPSILDGQSSFEHANGTSLSFDTISTSPLAVQADSQYFGSFGACDSSLLSPLGAINDSPILDTRYDRIPETFTPGSLESTTETVFNPYVTDSSHSFSGLDVRASRLFSNLGTWADQPRIIEPIAEDDGGRAEVEPIAIPNSFSQNYNSALASYRRSDGEYELHNRSRAITIPDATPGPTYYNNRTSASVSVRRPPPILSVSPVTSRYPRGVALSRSASLSRRKASTPSPSPDSYGWVSYHPNPLTHRLAPTSTEGMPGRAPKGRKRALTAEQRRHAALMRIVGACSNCQRRKEKCDPGTPCRACLEHYKGDLVNHPCRDHTLVDLSAAFLSDRLGWHPTTRPLESFIPAGNFEISKEATYTLPLNFGFGPTFPVSVHAVQLNEDNPLVHEHIIYSWPPQPYTGPSHKHAVLPAVLTADAQYHLLNTLDSHLSLLVAHHFRAFPLYCSPLRILRDIYVFSRSIPASSPHYRILHQALKLLVLVHIGGDITLPSRSESSMLEQLIRSTMDIPQDLTPTPCFIRSQFGAIMPGLALSLMKDVLTSLEQLLLNKDCDEWPIALAVLTTVLMTVESIHYHAAKLPYHNRYNATRSPSTEEDVEIDDHGVKSLLEFYRACFSGCHARLRPDWEGESMQSHQTGTPEDAFIQNLREAIKKAETSNYLAKKAKEKRQDEDMGYFFDRLVARLFTMRP